MNGLGQGPDQQAMLQAAGAQAATREVNLKAVQEDLFMAQELIDTLDSTVRNLQDHLMGAQPMLEKGNPVEADKPSPSGTIPLLCHAGSTNIHKLRQVQERVNQICYELGEGR